MKKQIAAALTAILLMLSISTPAAYAAGVETGFDDVDPGAWYAQAVAYCHSSGLIDGTGERTFSPDAPMTRGLLALAFYRSAGSPAAGGADLPDVPGGAPYAAAVRWAVGEGVMSGYTGGLFGPEDTLTREQIATVLWRYEGSPSAPRGTDYADESSISAYAAQAVDWARSAGMMSGIDGYRFDPQGVTTRAQAAMILMNYIRKDYVLRELAALPNDCQPKGMAVMEDGALLVADSYHKVLWRVSGGECAVFAGGGGGAADPYGQPMGGYNDASPAESLFQTPWALAPFLEGWAVSDTGNGALRLVTADAVQTVNAVPADGSLPANDYGAAFTYPTGLAADGEGNLYAADTHQGLIVKITPDGAATVFASGLNDPMGLCWRDGALYAAEAGASRIVRIEDGQISVVAGSGAAGLRDGAAAQAMFYEPQAVAVDSSGTVYVADTGNSAIRQIKDGAVNTLVVRDPGNLEDMYPISPTGLLVQGSTLYVCDSFSRKILVLSLR